ncbi:MAG: hypothetical protein ACR2MQ_16035 [Gemmatimonadaceae bacterium]
MHELANVDSAQVACDGDMCDHFTVMTIENESDLDYVSVPARDLKPVTAPALVRDIAPNEPSVCAAGSPAR